MALSNVPITPGSGANIAVYPDGSAIDHPAGVLEFLVGAAPTPVTAAAPLPVVVPGSVSVTGTFWQATQPVSGSVSVANFPATQPVSLAELPALAAGSAAIGGVTQVGTWTVGVSGTVPVSGAVSVANFPGTQAVSGTVSVANFPATQSVVAVGQPVRSRAFDTIAAAVATDALMSGTTALTPMFAPINASASGDNTVVAAVAGKTIRVLEYVLVVAGAVAVKFASGPGGTALTGAFAPASGGGVGGSYCPVGLFQCLAPGAALVLNLSAAVQVSGHLVYLLL